VGAHWVDRDILGDEPVRTRQYWAAVALVGGSAHALGCAAIVELLRRGGWRTRARAGVGTAP